METVVWESPQRRTPSSKRKGVGAPGRGQGRAEAGAGMGWACSRNRRGQGGLSLTMLPWDGFSGSIKDLQFQNSHRVWRALENVLAFKKKIFFLLMGFHLDPGRKVRKFTEATGGPGGIPEAMKEFLPLLSDSCF